LDRLGQTLGEDRPLEQVLRVRLLRYRLLLELRPLVLAEASGGSAVPIARYNFWRFS
jgi:hypothetical protein